MMPGAGLAGHRFYAAEPVVTQHDERHSGLCPCFGLTSSQAKKYYFGFNNPLYTRLDLLSSGAFTIKVEWRFE